MAQKNIFYAQAGGVTSVINVTANAVIKTTRRYKSIGKVYAGLNGILGALNEELIDTSLESLKNINALKYTPSGAFGSCRYKLENPNNCTKEYERIIEVFKAHNIGYFLYNGGNDSIAVVDKLSSFCAKKRFPLQCIGIPKTIDNDILHTDCCPGFGSVAKYISTSIMEAGLDVRAMAKTSTKVFILEVMGRHVGWIAAASGLANSNNNSLPPHIILFPEIIFNENLFLSKVNTCVKKYGFCTIVASEGLRDHHNKFLSASIKDSFGHFQLGGVAPKLGNIIKRKLGYKCQWAIANYLQRSARHLSSKTDFKQAYAVGKAAVKMAVKGKNNVMPIIIRKKETPYKWKIGEVKISLVANREKKLPKSFISKDGFHISSKCRSYLSPLIQGEIPPKFKNGLPVYTYLKNHLVKKKLPPFTIL